MNGKEDGIEGRGPVQRGLSMSPGHSLATGLCFLPEAFWCSLETWKEGGGSESLSIVEQWFLFIEHVLLANDFQHIKCCLKFHSNHEVLSSFFC